MNKFGIYISDETVENFFPKAKEKYWEEIKNTKNEKQLKELLKFHERIYCLPSSQDPGNMTKKERLDIIFFIRQRLREFE